MKAIWIKPAVRGIVQWEYNSLEDLRQMVGGPIEFAYRFALGDILYVDEEGKLKKNNFGFTFPGGRDIYVGNGVIVGPEIGDTMNTEDPSISVLTLTAMVVWHGK